MCTEFQACVIIWKMILLSCYPVSCRWRCQYRVSTWLLIEALPWWWPRLPITHVVKIKPGGCHLSTHTKYASIYLIMYQLHSLTGTRSRDDIHKIMLKMAFCMFNRRPSWKWPPWWISKGQINWMWQRVPWEHVFQISWLYHYLKDTFCHPVYRLH